MRPVLLFNAYPSVEMLTSNIKQKKLFDMLERFEVSLPVYLFSSSAFRWRFIFWRLLLAFRIVSKTQANLTSYNSP